MDETGKVTLDLGAESAGAVPLAGYGHCFYEAMRSPTRPQILDQATDRWLRPTERRAAPVTEPADTTAAKASSWRMSIELLCMRHLQPLPTMHLKHEFSIISLE